MDEEEDEEEEEVVAVEGFLDLGMSRLELSRLEGGVGRDDRLMLLDCPWLRTDEVFAGCTRGIEGAFGGPGRRMRFSGAPGSCFILTSGAAVLEATEARGKFGLDFGGFIVAAGTRSRSCSMRAVLPVGVYFGDFSISRKNGVL